MAKGHSPKTGPGGKRPRGHGHSHGRGRPGSAEYRAWAGMKARCHNPNVKAYPLYGGRGITVCARWRADFAAFLADVGRRPSPRHSLDRIDNGGGYTCGHCQECRANGRGLNCRWATMAQQCLNRRSNVRWSFGGRTLTITEWARELGVAPMVLRIRVLRRGWTVEEALTTPRRRRHPAPRRLKVQARNAVNHAIAAGKMPPACGLACVRCGKPAEHYHHRSGYEPEHWLDVEPRCSRCNLRAAP